MENASKALLIGGAIVIVIMIIGLGVIIFGKAEDYVNSNLGEMDATTVATANSKFTKYNGVQKGSNVKTLLSLISAHNGSYSASDASRVIKVTTKRATLNSIKVETNKTDGTTISAISATVKDSASYKVEFTYAANGLITGVTITD